MKKVAVKIMVTGGTFDKEYNELNGSLFFKDTHVPEILKLGRCRISTNVESLMMIDSLEMSQKDREFILERCLQCEEDQIVITHGTDTMEDTAKVLGAGIKDKTIILTGALVPYKFGSSDGLFNLGCAIGLAQSLPHGVYVAMNGKYFNWNNVRKNKIIGDFEELS